MQASISSVAITIYANDCRDVNISREIRSEKNFSVVRLPAIIMLKRDKEKWQKSATCAIFVEKFRLQRSGPIRCTLKFIKIQMGTLVIWKSAARNKIVRNGMRTLFRGQTKHCESCYMYFIAPTPKAVATEKKVFLESFVRITINQMWRNLWGKGESEWLYRKYYFNRCCYTLSLSQNAWNQNGCYLGNLL